MRAIFLSDAHLQQPDDSNYRLLLDFLNSLRGTVDTLCILGDLFDFRVGLPGLCFPEHEPLLQVLHELGKNGTRLIYLEGNHDFHLQEELTRRLGAEVYPGPITLELHGLRILLCHGDLINRADWRYRLLHRVLRHPMVYQLAGMLPQSSIEQLRHKLQHKSKGRYRHDRSRWDYRAIIRSYAASVHSQGHDALLLGHFHLPFIECQDQFVLVSLGDWISQFSYAELSEGQLRLLTYQP